MERKRVLGLVLAGGSGTRLWPLTADRSAAAVPFGGLYRVVDFALSNLINGGLQRIYVLTQYKSHSLNKHITTTWRLSSLLDNYVTPVPAQQWLGPRWQAGSADAIYQSLDLIYTDRPDLVVVVGADHVYRMDPRQMVEAHLAWGAGVTVAAIAVPVRDAAGFGVAATAPDGHLIEVFLEKPAHPPEHPGWPGAALASMGYYVFDTDVLVTALKQDAADQGSQHSMGGDVIPALAAEGIAHAYDFRQNQVPGAGPRDAGYWREVGTIDSYFEAHMDLCAVDPAFNLYNRRWPILTHVPPYPPVKFTHDGERAGRAIDSVISNGVIVSGGLVSNSVLSPGVLVDSGSLVNQAVIMSNSLVGRHTVVENAILDKNVVVGDGTTVGVDKDHDRARGLFVSKGGITVVGKGRVIDELGVAGHHPPGPRPDQPTAQPTITEIMAQVGIGGKPMAARPPSST